MPRLGPGFSGLHLSTVIASVEQLRWPAHGLVVALATFLCVSLLRRGNRALRLSLVTPIALNGVALSSLVVLAAMSFAGASSTVQLNVGSESAMNAWSTWATVWPFFLIANLAAVVVTPLWTLGVLAAMAVGAMRTPWSYALLALVTCAHVGFAYVLFFELSPTA